MRYFLIDRIDELKRFSHAVGRKCVTLSEDCFEQHFPGQPVYPGALLIEGLAQLGGALMEISLHREGSQHPRCVLSKVEAKFRDFARPGDVLELGCEVLGHHDDSARLRGRVRRDGDDIAEATLLFVILHIEDAALEASRRQFLADLTRATRFVE